MPACLIVDEVARVMVAALDQRVDVRLMAQERAVQAAERLMDARLSAADQKVAHLSEALAALERAKANQDGRTAVRAGLVSAGTTAALLALQHWLVR